ncbi:fasciclin domain-containing protein, partial [Akkermansiaceae bacterium]|nr:fasciclin domain-containing protein [Akkermansiaceae bacterium]
MITLLKLFNVRGLIFKEARLRSITLYFLFVIGSITQGYGADPAEAKTVGRVIGQRADLSFFLKVLEKTELGSAFSERTDFNNTIFVPNNKAFENLPAGAVETLLDPRNDDRLEEVFNYHVINRSEPS